MDVNSLRLVLLAIGVVVIFGIWWHGTRHKDQREEHDESNQVSDEHLATVENNISQQNIPEVIVFSLVALGNNLFHGESLLKILLEQGFQFGDNKVFQFCKDSEKPLFCLAAATDEGTFDLTSMPEFQTKGLVLYMKPKAHQHPTIVFDEMVSMAERLAEELHAELQLGEGEEWSDDRLSELFRQLSTSYTAFNPTARVASSTA